MNVIESSLRRAFGLKGEWPLKTFLFNTHMGNISVDPEVIAQYAGNVRICQSAQEREYDQGNQRNS